MRLYEKTVEIGGLQAHSLQALKHAISPLVAQNERVVRAAIVASDQGKTICELGLLAEGPGASARPDIFALNRRPYENTTEFNVVLAIPTGIGSELGGHAGDGAAAARLIAGTCNRLITHPNVVNASDINEMPQNGLFVEGSVLSRLLQGSIGLQPVRANRLLVLIDKHDDAFFTSSAINSASAARATLGLDVVEVIQLEPSFQMMARFTDFGVAAGSVLGLEKICAVLDGLRGRFDAVALSSVIDVPFELHARYFAEAGQMVNPWGGVEAMLTHALSSIYDIPSAHSPMFESRDIANLDVGIVDPRMAAEAVSVTFLHCILKGLHKSPSIIPICNCKPAPGLLTAADVAALVIPNGCLGLPTLAALEQGIKVIAVRENSNLMKNDLARLPWASGQLTIVDNYIEAAGALIAFREGVAPSTVRRPLTKTAVSVATFSGLPELPGLSITPPIETWTPANPSPEASSEKH